MEEPRTFAEAKRMLADCRDVLGWHHGQPCPPIDVERLASAIDHHFDSCLRTHRDPDGVQEFATAIAAEYEALA